MRPLWERLERWTEGNRQQRMRLDQAPWNGNKILRKSSKQFVKNVAVDVFIPGCPPPADAIFAVVSDLLAGRTPNPAGLTRFGR